MRNLSKVKQELNLTITAPRIEHQKNIINIVVKVLGTKAFMSLPFKMKLSSEIFHISVIKKSPVYNHAWCSSLSLYQERGESVSGGNRFIIIPSGAFLTNLMVSGEEFSFLQKVRNYFPVFFYLEHDASRRSSAEARKLLFLIFSAARLPWGPAYHYLFKISCTAWYFMSQHLYLTSGDWSPWHIL